MLDGFPVGSVALIGELTSVEESPTFLKLQLEDGTGSIEVKKWNDTPNASDGDGSAPAPSGSLGLKTGMWVAVHCSVKEFNGTLSLNTSSVHTTDVNKDFNAITHHYLTAIVESLGKTKGQLRKLAGAGQGAAAAAPVYGQPAAFVAQRSAGAAVVAESSGGDLTEHLKKIFEREAPTDHGWSIDEIQGQLTFKADRTQVKNTITVMCDDGQLYSTIDDEHFASTM